MAETNQQKPEGEISNSARPNVFIAVKVESHDILNVMASVQEDLIKVEPLLKDLLVPVAQAHLTLLVFRVEEEQMEKAKEIFEKVIQEKVAMKLCNKDSFDVEFEGVGSFDKKVLFVAPVSGREILEHLNKVLYAGFTESGFVCEPMFTPHVTLVKTKFKDGKEIGGIPSGCFEQFKTKHFGVQTIRSVQLLSMKKPKTDEGYFFCEQEINLLDILEKKETV